MRRMPRQLPHLVLAALAALLSACAPMPPGLGQALPADVLLLGELHDDPRHQDWHREAVQALAGRGDLAALALEMAEQGATTLGLPADASEEAVRTALRWNEQAWPWTAYGPVVMTAVRAGVPVVGANLPRAQMRAAMADASLDQALPAQAMQRQQAAVRDGHCGLLAPQQVLPMARIQVARDRSMAQVVAQAARPGLTVVLVAGSAHVEPSMGVPQHLPARLQVRPLAWPVPVTPKKDYCAELRQQMPPAR